MKRKVSEEKKSSPKRGVAAQSEVHLPGIMKGKVSEKKLVLKKG